MEEKIDFVVPYVNNNDPVWKKAYMDYFVRVDPKRLASMRNGRYEDIGLIYYQLQLVNKFMPFINNIYLILSNKEQVIPSLLPKNVKIVLHKEFIPFRYLPTFNSTTIEMFLPNIKGLSEYFIYANDDMIPIKPLSITQFFNENGQLRINWKEEVEQKQSIMFKNQCINSYQHVCRAIGVRPDRELLRPLHSFTPMRLSHSKEIQELMKDYVLPQIRAYRTDNQHNQYIYPVYEHLKYGTEPTTIRFYYSQLDETQDRLLEKIKESDIICVNLVKDKKNGELVLKELEKLCE